MMLKHILASSIFCLSLSPALVQGEDNILAQPITISPLAGSDQTDFFYTQGFENQYVSFFSIFPYKVRNVPHEMRFEYDVRISHLGDSQQFFYPVVAPGTSPLVRKAIFHVTPGVTFDNFIHSLANNTVIDRQLFHIPGLGLYQKVETGVPALIYPESAAYPISGAALRFPDHLISDPDFHTAEFRVIFGGGYPAKKAFVPYQSTGSIRFSKQLPGTTPSLKALNGANYPSEFTTATFNGDNDSEVYFVDFNPATNAPDIFKTVVATPTAALPACKAIPITAGLPAIPNYLTGFDTGLFYTLQNPGDNFTKFYWTPDGTTAFAEIDDSTSGLPIQGAYQLTPQLRPTSTQVAHSLAFSSYDPNAGANRLGIFDTGGGNTSFFADFPNVTAVTTTSPNNITPTGEFYYFSAQVSGAGPYMLRTAEGQGDVQYVDAVTDGQHISNIKEVVNVSDGSSNGSVYFVGDATLSGVAVTDILFTVDTSAASDLLGNAIASPVLTKQGNYVTGAHNLRAVRSISADVFRLYFSAPVSDLPATMANSEYSLDVHKNLDGKDHFNKPWVVKFD